MPIPSPSSERAQSLADLWNYAIWVTSFALLLGVGTSIYYAGYLSGVDEEQKKAIQAHVGCWVGNPMTGESKFVYTPNLEK